MCVIVSALWETSQLNVWHLEAHRWWMCGNERCLAGSVSCFATIPDSQVPREWAHWKPWLNQLNKRKLNGSESVVGTYDQWLWVLHCLKFRLSSFEYFSCSLFPFLWPCISSGLSQMKNTCVVGILFSCSFIQEILEIKTFNLQLLSVRYCSG